MTPHTPLHNSSTPSSDPDIEAHRVVAALGYLGVLFLVPMFLYKDSPFAQYHAKQGFVLFVIWVVTSILFSIPFFGPLYFLLLVVVTVIGCLKAYEGAYYKLPVIYDLSRKFHLSP